MAITSSEHNMCRNDPFLTQGGSDKNNNLGLTIIKQTFSTLMQRKHLKMKTVPITPCASQPSLQYLPSLREPPHHVMPPSHFNLI